MMTPPDTDTLHLAHTLTLAWLGNANTKADTNEALSFLKSAFSMLTDIAGPQRYSAGKAPPSAGNASAYVSICDDYIVSMIDGKKYKSLKRHLAKHGLSPQEYRSRFGLPDDYPMNAKSYSASRRDLALKSWEKRKKSTETRTIRSQR